MLCCEFAIDVFLEACANTSWLLMEVNDWHRAMALLVQGDFVIYGDGWIGKVPEDQSIGKLPLCHALTIDFQSDTLNLDELGRPAGFGTAGKKRNFGGNLDSKYSSIFRTGDLTKWNRNT